MLRVTTSRAVSSVRADGNKCAPSAHEPWRAGRDRDGSHTYTVWTLAMTAWSRGCETLPTTERSPRSRRAVGVGDVAGERGDRAALVRSLQQRGLRCRHRVGPSRRRLRPARRSAPYRAPRLATWMEPDAFRDQVANPLEIVVATERTILARQHVTGQGRASGIDLEPSPGRSSTFDDGRPDNAMRSTCPTRRTRPSKPPGLRSRRCRRRTSRLSNAGWGRPARGSFDRWATDGNNEAWPSSCGRSSWRSRSF